MLTPAGARDADTTGLSVQSSERATARSSEVTSRMPLTWSRDAGSAPQPERGTALADPKEALAAAPQVPLELDLAYESLIDLYGLSSDEGAGGGIEGGETTIATGHYQGPCRVHGTITVGQERFSVSGLCFRAHSRRPRRRP